MAGGDDAAEAGMWPGMRCVPTYRAAPTDEGTGIRILFVTNYRDGWSENASHGTFAERQARSLREAGVDVSSFDIGRSHSPIALLKSLSALRAEIRRVKPDLLHAQQGTVVSLVTALALHPMIITYTGADILPGASVSKLRVYLGIALSNLSLLRARRAICMTQQMHKAIWWRRSRVTIIPHGVDTTVFTPGSREEARAALGWDPQRPIIMIDGARDPRNKGLDVAEAAARLARVDLPDLELFVSKGISPERMPVYFRAADALICASRQEGSPNVVKEAMACALPVIGVPVGDVPERLAGVEPSVVVARDAAAIARAIVEIARGRRRSNGPRFVEEISLPRIAARVVNVYEQALGIQTGAKASLTTLSNRTSGGNAA